jgi:hypothetical protein
MLDGKGRPGQVRACPDRPLGGIQRRPPALPDLRADIQKSPRDTDFGTEEIWKEAS